MLVAQIKDLENNIDKYIELAKLEEIQVFDGDKRLLTLEPNRMNLKDEWQKLFGSLPKDVSIIDIERE